MRLTRNILAGLTTIDVDVQSTASGAGRPSSQLPSYPGHLFVDTIY